MCLRLTLAVCLAASLQLSAAAPKTLHTPLFFSENHGQYPAGSRYGAATKGLLLGIEADRATIRIASRQDSNTVTMKLVGADPKAALTGGDLSTGHQSVFLGADSKQWVPSLSLYANVRVLNAYRGIDVNYHGDRDLLEYDFVAAPGADPSQIKLSFTGAKEVRLTKGGALELVLPDGTLSHKKPELYQLSHGQRRAVNGGFVRAGDSFAFRVGSYDRSAPLIIDPQIEFATYLGTVDSTDGRSIGVDSAGNVYVAGNTCGIFPTTAGSYQTAGAFCPAFVTKFNPDGKTLAYSALIGGNGSEYPNRIVVDSTGAVYMIGYTFSTNFPTTPGAFRQSASFHFVLKLNSAGNSLIYSTFIADSTSLSDIAVDSSGNAVIVGSTGSPSFPTVLASQPMLAGYQDAVVAKLNASGSALLFSTYLGGTGAETANGIALDSAGNVYVVGQGADQNFPSTSGAYKHGTSGTSSAFAARYSSTGILTYATLLTEGPGTFSAGYGVSPDASGNAIIVGSTSSALAVTPAGVSTTFGGGATDGFALKLNASGSALLWATFFGGSGDETPFRMRTDANGNIYLAGWTSSGDLPLASPISGALSASPPQTAKSTNGAASWAVTSTFTGFNPAFLYSAKVGSNTVLYYMSEGVNLKSVDGGVTWTYTCMRGSDAFSTSTANGNYMYSMYYSSNDGGLTCRANPISGFADAIAADPSVPSTAYMYSNGLYKTTDGGFTWNSWAVTLPAGVSASDRILAIAVHPANSNLIYAAVQGKGIMRTTDGGATWILANVPVIANARIVPDPSDQNRAFFVNAVLYRTLDRGASWTALSTPASAQLVVDATNGQNVYMQSNSGILKSTDGGLTFVQSNAGLRNYRGSALAMDPFDSNVLYTTTPQSNDVFVAKLSPAGSLLFSTYFGGNGNEYARDLAVDQNGAIYITGFTTSGDLPTTIGAFQPSLAGSVNAFIAKFATAARAVSVLPQSLPASGTSAFAFADSVGYADIETANVLISASTATNGACYVRYTRQTNTLQLLLDNSTWSTALTPGGAGTVSNNQCTLAASGSSVSATGSNLTLNLNLTFSQSFSGSKAVYLLATDNATLSTGWVLKGTYNTAASAALRFVPVTPCRIADTRNPSGAFGGPFIASGGSRSFTLPASACSIPVTAQAYSLNLTVVPHGSLPYVTLWPTGQTQPFVSTLNSLDGRVKANAAIVPAGTNGAVSVYAAGETDVVLDINGYFVSATDTSALAFYPLSPCRMADTRNATGALGGPSLPAQGTRSFPVRSTCSVPATAQAYSLNFTAVPKPTLPYLTVWPTGGTKPLVSTLNAQIANGIVANAAIVPAGTNGDVSVYAEGATDVVIDINGYFAPASPPNGLSLYNVSPCRVVDTRLQSWAPALNGGRTFAINTSCNLSALASAYVMNATVVPSSSLGYLTLWPAGSGQPFVSTLNALDGAITSNAAIVPTNNGSVAAFTTSTSELVMDVSGFFAP